MMIHPDTQPVLHASLLDGICIVRLFHAVNQEIWRAPGRDILLFRQMNSTAWTSGDANSLIWVTDQPDQMDEVIVQQGYDSPESWREIRVPGWRLPLYCGCGTGVTGKPKPGDTIRRLKTVDLIVLQDHRDVRWRSMGTPLTQLTLKGILAAAGYRVRIRRVEAGDAAEGWRDPADVTAFSVFEDQFEDVVRLVHRVKFNGGVWTILGGVMINLVPEHSAAHCPGADIILRGEAEENLISCLVGLDADPEDPGQMFRFAGVPGLLFRNSWGGIWSHFDQVPVVRDGAVDNPGMAWLEPADQKNGVEFSTSRGCPRTCVFCSHVHGKALRRSHVAQVQKDVRTAVERLRNLDEAAKRFCPVFNINDDDLFLDPDRGLRILDACRDEGIRIWGIQTSIAAMKSKKIRTMILNRIVSREYFVEQPVIWFGTDAFHPARLKRLGKGGTVEDIRAIAADVNTSGCRGYHYWIVTDAASDWAEFFEELETLRVMVRSFPGTFRLLPNAGTLVPYPSTPVYARRLADGHQSQIILRHWLHIPDVSELDYPLVMHERPEDDFLYALVEPRAVVGERLIVDSRRFIQAVREGAMEEAIMEAMSVLSGEIAGMPREQARREELERVKQCIMNQW
ncbi:hypothetical protein JXA80_13455 [bacterium]|nr:hypothetical protein [candidate division CSSED10-310 bacterium]